MTEKDAQKHLEELEKQFPDSFHHSGAREGEIFVGEIDVAINPKKAVENLEKNGIHARLGVKCVVIGGVSKQSLFVNARDYVRSEFR